MIPFIVNPDRNLIFENMERDAENSAMADITKTKLNLEVNENAGQDSRSTRSASLLDHIQTIFQDL